jgi:hypothetical protein
MAARGELREAGAAGSRLMTRPINLPKEAMTQVAADSRDEA